MAVLRLILLCPVLAVQILWVMLRARRLPEARGPRSGHTGQGPDLRILIFGDSSAAGVGVDHQDQALAGQLPVHLSTKYTVHWRLVAQSGLTTRAALSGILSQAGNEGRYDVIVLALGVNDATRFVSYRRWWRGTRRLSAALTSGSPAARVYLTPVPPLQDFPAVPMPLAREWGHHAARLTDMAQSNLADIPNAQLVNAPVPLTPELMASDGFHPNAQGYALWAKLLARQILRDIGPPRDATPEKDNKILNSPLDLPQVAP
jgi:lysophospholipase L1-like esterase